ALHRDRLHVWRALGIERIREVANESLQTIGLEERWCGVQERRGRVALTGFHRAANAKPRGLEHVGSVGRICLQPDQVLLTANRGAKNLLLVQRELEIVWIFETTNGAEIRAIEPDLKLVVAI